MNPRLIPTWTLFATLCLSGNAGLARVVLDIYVSILSISNLLNGTKIVSACQDMEKVLSRSTSAIKSLQPNTNILTKYSIKAGVNLS